MLAQFLFIARQQRIGGQHQVVAVDGVEALQPLRAVQQQHAQGGREAGRFVLPVAHQAGGSDHQRGLGQAARFFFGQDVRQGLDRFSEAHVVGQDAGQVILAQKLQPRQTFALIIAQRGLQASRRRDLLHAAEFTQFLAHVAQPFAAQPAQLRAAREFRQARGIQDRQPHAGPAFVGEVELP